MKAELRSFNKSTQSYWRKHKVNNTLFHLASCASPESLLHPFRSHDYGGWIVSKLALPNWMAIYQNEWITFKLDGSPNWTFRYKLNGILSNWMAIYQNEWITIELKGALPKRMDHVKLQLSGSQIEWFVVNWMAYIVLPNQNEWIMFKLNGDLPKWMDHSWMATANWILDYAQGAWDRFLPTTNRWFK